MMQQMNLFNTSPEVAGFKLDYLELGYIRPKGVLHEYAGQ